MFKNQEKLVLAAAGVRGECEQADMRERRILLRGEKHMNEIYKYPRTHHIEGSGLQPGDEDLDVVSFHEFAGRFLVVEEKMDGANSAVSFSPEGALLLQSRGHY